MRTPRIDELHKIVELISFYMEEKNESMDDLNIPAWKEMLKMAQDSDSNIYGAITERDGRFTGLIVGLISAPWYSKAPMAYVGTLYVHPTFRGSPAAVKLIKGFEHWAKDHHIKDIRFEVDSEIMPARVYSLVERLGYRETGRIFEKGV